MFYIKKGITLFLITATLGTSQTMAAEKWWEKAIDLLSGENEVQLPGEISTTEIADAFREALSIGSQQVVAQLGTADGFNTDPAVHIPLPGELARVKSMLANVGMSRFVDDLELKLNRAAEKATPIAKELFLQAISEMEFDDVVTIYQGQNNSATLYFQEEMSQSLSQQMAPIVEESLMQVGAVKALDDVLGNYNNLPFVPDVSADLTKHVVEKGMEGIFFYMAKEEAAIRENPVKQTTELLRKVFNTAVAN